MATFEKSLVSGVEKIDSIWTQTFPIRAIGKGRPRFGKNRTFTPQATLNAEQELRWHLQQAGNAPLLDGPVHVGVSVIWKRPKSVSKKRTHPVVKPDLDNVLKLVCDAANGILWVDDVQVCSVSITKDYGEADSLTITLMAL